MRLGVIDCGTNTFHLLVVDAEADGKYKEVYRKRRYVRIGQEGLDRIGEQSFQRGITCLVDYKEKVESLGVSKLKVFGTEAFRRASNGMDFINAVKEATGFEMKMISGEEEARLIHLGVMQAIPLLQEKKLIMDVGGGSVEFIVADDEQVFWSKSFPIGVQVLYSKFHQKDPIPEEQMDAMYGYLKKILKPLFDILEEHETPVLAGASGSFEVVEGMSETVSSSSLYSIVPVADYLTMHRQIIRTSLAERQAMEKLPNERADLIVVAFLLIDFIIKKAGIKKIITSAYAMKEGILADMVNEK